MPEIAALPWDVFLKWLFGGSGISLPLVVTLYLTRRSQNLQRDQQKAAASAEAVGGLVQLNAALRAELDRYIREIELLRSARWSVEDVLLELHSAAIAARAMVHDLQRSAGITLTDFPALPQPGWSATSKPSETHSRDPP
ncbi:hypothetical protein [Acidisoma sp. 7E03]